jgi:dolichol-phosphate mannosyltransferase
MYKGKKIGIAVPAYNVEREVVGVLGNVPDYVDFVTVVDDASLDHTSQAIAKCATERIEILCHKENTGVGGAVITGFRQLLTKGTEILVKIDGDGQMDMSKLPRLLDAIIDEGYDYAKGNRFLHTREIHRMPLLRLIGNFLLTFLTKLCSGYWNIFDPQNGYVAIKRECLLLLDLDHMAKRFFFENDMLVHLNIFNFRVKDVPMPAVYNTEKSSLKIRHVLLTFPLKLTGRTLYRIYQKYILRDFSQIALFLILGFLMMAWGVLFGSYHWFLSLNTGRLASTGTVMVALLPFLMGFQLFLQGIILDIQSTPK